MTTETLPALPEIPSALQNQRITHVEVCLSCQTRKVYFEGHKPNMRPTILAASWPIPLGVKSQYIQPWNCPACCEDKSRFSNWPAGPPH